MTATPRPAGCRPRSPAHTPQPLKLYLHPPQLSPRLPEAEPQHRLIRVLKASEGCDWTPPAPRKPTRPLRPAQTKKPHIIQTLCTREDPTGTPAIHSFIGLTSSPSPHSGLSESSPAHGGRGDGAGIIWHTVPLHGRVSGGGSRRAQRCGAPAWATVSSNHPLCKGAHALPGVACHGGAAHAPGTRRCGQAHTHPPTLYIARANLSPPDR